MVDKVGEELLLHSSLASRQVPYPAALPPEMHRVHRVDRVDKLGRSCFQPEVYIGLIRLGRCCFQLTAT